MTEQTRPNFDAEPYWTDERELGQVFFGHDHRAVAVRSHITRERYRGLGSESVFRLSQQEGERTYVQSRFVTPPIPRVTGEHRVGDAQAWFYPADRTLVLWELLLEPPYQRDDPRENLLLRSLWLRYEQFLARRFPDAQRFVTTWEDTYSRADWTGFLTSVGYRELALAVFEKPVQRIADP